MTGNYEKIKELVENGDLRLVAIDSPSRCGSTTLEIVLAESPSVHSHVHQPFHLPYSHPYTPPKDREEDAYGLLLKAFESASANTEIRPVVIVAKEMTRNLGVGEQMERWHKLADKQIFLCRNPQLSVESLMRLDLNSMEDRPEAFSEPLNDYAKRHGFEDVPGEIQVWRDGEVGLGQHWRKMLDHVLKTRDYTTVGQLHSEFGINWDLNAHIQQFQDDYRATFGQKTLEKIFETSSSGWQNMGAIRASYKGGECLVVECTVMRTLPEDTFREISEFLGIEFTPTMIKGWTQATGDHFNRGATEPGAMPAYAAVLGSDHIMRARHTPSETAMFPDIFKEHLQDVAFPAYLEMLVSGKMVRPKGKEEIERILDTSVNDDGDKLRDVDPLFAYAVIATDDAIPLRERSKMLTSIREKDGTKFKDVFDGIDSIMAKLKMIRPTTESRASRG